MAIVCCSQDRRLIEKLSSLAGKNDVIVRPDIHLVNENDMKNGEVLIVDLKYAALPQGKTFSLPIIAVAEIPTFQESLLLLQRGIRGYGNRHMRLENLAQAIQNVTAGQIWLPPAIITQLISTAGTGSAVQPDTRILEPLSEREQEVARHVSRGMSNQEIADTMHVSLRTVKAHLSSIYQKTGLRNRLELGLKLKEGR